MKKTGIKTTVVYSLNSMMDLVRKGHNVIAVKPNLKRPGMQVFVFATSEELSQEIVKMSK